MLYLNLSPNFVMFEKSGVGGVVCKGLLISGQPKYSTVIQ